MATSSTRVVVAMSGGVDSSVAAFLLKKQGYDVLAIFMKNWHDESVTISAECPWLEDSYDAMIVAKKLMSPFQVIDFSKEYKKRIVDYMFSEYKVGRTPNPDILCNREIKFKSFLNYALSIGADFIATGHYAALKNVNDRTYLCRAKDNEKDQTYFLHEVKEDEFKKCLFPLSNLYKHEVRKIAEDINLSVSKKKDSVGICFVGEKNLKDFLGRFMNLDKHKYDYFLHFYQKHTMANLLYPLHHQYSNPVFDLLYRE